MKGKRKKEKQHQLWSSKNKAEATGIGLTPLAQLERSGVEDHLS
jgi:hypothetical protein